MRRSILLRSVRRHLEAAEILVDAAVLWRRHRLMVPYCFCAFTAVAVGAALVGFQAWPARAGLGLAGAGVAAMATTEYRVLAQTDTGFVLLASSRVRQYAVRLIERLPSCTTIELVTNQMVMSEWAVDGVRYTVPKSSEQSMARMAGTT